MYASFLKSRSLTSFILFTFLFFYSQHKACAQNDPTFTSTPPGAITFGNSYAYLIEVEDLNSDDIEVEVTNLPLPSWLSFTPNGDGTYSLSGNPDAAGSYSVALQVFETAIPANSSSQIVNIEVNQASQSITFNALATKTYGDADFSLSATASSGLAVSFSIVSGPATLSGNTLSITGAGTVVVAANQAGNTNYSAASEVQQSFVVNKKDLQVNADPQSISFGDPLPTLTFTYESTDFVNADSPADIDTAPTISTTATSSSIAGSYPITLSGGSDNNYNLLLNDATLTITKASQSITFNTLATKTYGDADFSLSATASSGLTVSFSIVSGPATLSGNTVSITGAGTVVVAANQAGNPDFNPATEVQQSFVVNKKDLQVNADPVSIVYGDPIPTLTFTYEPADFVNADSPADIDTAPTISTTATGSSIAGSYPITLSGGSDNNYNLLLNDATLTINQASQSITFNSLATKTYGDADFSLSATASSGLAVSFSIVSGPATLSGNTVSITGAGTVVVAANQAGNPDFNPATEVQQSFVVNKKDLQVNADPVSIVYGDPIPTLTFTYEPADFVNADSPADIDTAPTISTTATGSSIAGSYPITLSGGSDDNYALILNNSTLSIGTASQSITFNSLATKTYGDADFSLSATASSGLAVSFSIVSGPATLSGNTVSITGAGTVVVAANQAGNPDFNPATEVQQSFVVNKKDLQVNADPVSIVYGDPIPTLTFTYEPADFVNADSPADIDTAPTISTTATGSSIAGSYPITLSGGSDDNYALILNNSTLSIGTANQSITFNALATKTYGDPDFSLSATASSGLTVSFSIVSGPATLSGNTVSITGAGTVVVAANQAGNPDFNPATEVQQSFVVNKKDLQVNADPVSIVYGDPIPTLTFTYEPADFVNADSPADIDTAPTISTTATGSSIAGSYPITLSGGSDDNYALILNNSTLSIGTANQSITFNALATKTYGDPDFSLSATASSGLTVSFSIVSGPATLSGNTVSITGAGTVVVAANQAGNPDFNPATEVQQSFVVNKKDLQVNADPVSIVYGDPIPTLTFTYEPADFVNADSPADIDTAPTISTTATGSSIAGSYPITLSGGSDNNYNLLLNDATLTITKASQSITFNALATKTYGDADFSLSATASSGLAVSFSIVSGPATLSGNTVSITGAGTVVVAANQAGNPDFNPATEVQQSFVVNKKDLQVNADPVSIVYGDPIPTLTFTYEPADFVNADSPADIDTAPTISTTATSSSIAGSYPITLSGGSDDNYALILNNSTLSIGTANQSITFNTLATKTYGDADFSLSATASSGLAVSFSIVSGPATLSGNTVSITGAGTVVVAANQAGNPDFNPATEVQQSFVVNKKDLQVNADPISIVYGDPIPALTFTYEPADFVNADSPADIDTAPTISTTATGSSIAGSYPITLSGGTDNNYNLLLNDATLTITKASQSITFATLPTKTYGDADFSLSATASSGLTVSFSIVSGPATLSGNTVSITGAGTVVVAANQTGNTNYTAANEVQQSFLVQKAAATISFANILKNYTGSPLSPDFSTQPTGLNVSLLYNGSSIEPTDPGSYNISAVIADANYEGSANTVFIINGAPTVSNIPDLNLQEDQQNINNIILTDYFSDMEDEDSELSFNIINVGNDLFENLVINNNELSVELSANAFGTSIIEIRCTDSNGLSTSGSLSIIVAAVEDDPIIISNPIVSVNEDELYQYNISSEDADPNDILTTYSKLALPAWLDLTDNGDGTAILEGTANNNQLGSYGIVIEVKDQDNNIDQQFFNIEVINTNDPPVILSNPLTTASLNNEYSYTFRAEDEDPGDELSINALAYPNWLTIDSSVENQLTLTGTPLSTDREEPTFVNIEVSDIAGTTVIQEFFIIVNFPNSAPTFTSTPEISTLEDQTYLYNINTADVDGDPVEISLLTGPSWLELINTADNYSLSGTPENNDVGSVQVIISARDQLGASNNQTFILEVINVNDSPKFTFTPITNAIQNQLYTQELTYEDVDLNDVFSFDLLESPDWLSINSGSLTGTPRLVDVENSPHKISVRIQDEAGASDTSSYFIEVDYENQAPTLDPVPDTISLMEDDLIERSLFLTGISTGGEEDQNLSVTVESNNMALFENLEIIYDSPSDSAQLNFKLLPNANGQAQLFITVTDDGAQDINQISDTIFIQVSAINDAPYFTSTPITRGQAGNNYSYTIKYKDDDAGDQLSLELISGPSWLGLTGITNSTAILSGSIPTSATSTNLILELKDNSGEGERQSFNIDINTKPVVINLQDDAQEDIAFSISYQAIQELFTDDDGDQPKEISLSWQAGNTLLNELPVEKSQAYDFSADDEIIYLAPENFFGQQIISISISDGFIFSEPATITLNIEPVNDAPVLTNIESTTIEYIQGAIPITITETITINDIDNQVLDSAVISFDQNYNSEEDRLSIDNEDLEYSAAFDQATGSLTISANLNKSNFELLLQSVKYSNINQLTTDIEPKGISFKIADSLNFSQPISRELIVTEILPELDIVNAFTPNDDNVNDAWEFPNLNQFEDIVIKIYDHDRQILFECFDSDCAWDAYYNGNAVPAGSYFYSIELNNGRRVYEGYVNVLR